MEISDKVRLLGTWPLQVKSLNFLTMVCIAAMSGAQTVSRKVACNKIQNLEVKERTDLPGTFRKKTVRRVGL